jgi:hypothetical protein
MGCWQRGPAGWALAGLLLLPGAAWADRPQWASQTYPFAQQLDLSQVYAVTHAAPQGPLATIRGLGVDIRRVRTPAPSRPLNPLLAALPEADADLRRLYDDPYRLLKPLWRRDILAAQADVAADLFGRIRIGRSQEAIVEKLLSRYVDERSPYFDAVRRDQGRQYAEAMINNAIDIFNAVQRSTAFVAQAVGNLRAALLRKEIEPDQDSRLSDDDVAAVQRSTEAVARQLAVVRAEIQVLRDFQTR